MNNDNNDNNVGISHANSTNLDYNALQCMMIFRFCNYSESSDMILRYFDRN